LHKAIEESRKFAVGEYADALMAGDALPAPKRSEITQKLARLTGLSPDYIERTNLRIEIMRFTKELLRSERRTIGRIDARFTGIDRDAAGEHPEFDPSIAAIIGPYAGMLNDYVRNDLKFDSDFPYEVLTSRVRPWNYAPYENRYVNVAETLRVAMTQILSYTFLSPRATTTWPRRSSPRTTPSIISGSTQRCAAISAALITKRAI